MVIKFNNFEEKKLAFANAVKEGNEEQQAQALNNMLEALAQDVESDILNKAQAFSSDNQILQTRGQNVLTHEERKFFNFVIEEGGFKDTDILPKTTQDRIFDDLVQEHPLLDQIGIQNLGPVTEFIYGEPEGMAVWRVLFGKIQGQLNATFRKEKITQMVLTAFLPLHNDMKDLGPEWIERYVRTMLREAIAVGLEYGFVAGRGLAHEEPVGLLKEVNADSGAVSDKTPVGELTFKPGRKTINELRDVVKLLAKKVNEDGSDADRPKKIAGKVVMVTNPFDTFDIQANSTIQTANGDYVTKLPFNPVHTESIFVPEGQVVFFVRGEYIAALGGAMQMKEFDQTLAMEDATLYITKQYAMGKPKDKYTSQVYNLNLALEEDVVPEP